MEDNDCFSLMDENDSLISPHADDAADLTHLHSELEHIEAIGDEEKLGGVDLRSKCSEQLPQLVEMAEPDIPRKTGKLNLRKSLAWNSAFFESPGFLDADEISTMIDGAEKGKKQLLPGIDEDISRSSESISTLASDSVALESLEKELFKDIRASIQKSSISTSNRKAAPKETDKLVKCSLKKGDITSRNGISTNVTSMRQTGGMLGSSRISKKDPSSALVTQAGLRNGKSSSSLPQLPKVIPKPEATRAVTTKRAVLGANSNKTESNKSKVGGKIQVHVPMTTGLDGQRRSASRPASLQKASGLASSSAANKEVGRSSSSSNNSNSTFTEKIQKSTSTSISTKTKKPSKPVIQASSKIPLSRKAPSKSGLPSSLTSSKISSSISPSSSISEWSSASSSNSTVDRRLTSRTSIDTNSSRRSMDSETPSIMCSDVQSNDGISDRILNQLKESSSQDMKITSAQTTVVSRSLMMKPSGLRMPSPKIGFFDGAKPMVHTPNACRESQLRLPTGLPKIGAAIRSPVGRSKKAEGNMPSGKKAISGANTVLNIIKTASPRPSQESSRASMEGHGDSKSVLSPNISSEVGSSNKGTGKPRPEMTLTSTKIELQGQQSDSPKAFQKSASSGMSSEQSQSHLPVGIQSSSGSSKKIEGNTLAGKKATARANTVLDTSNAADPEPSRASMMKVHGNHRGSLGLDISSEARSSDEGTGKLLSKMTSTNTNTEVESQNLDCIKPFEESSSVGLSPDKSQSCLPFGLPKTEALISNPIGSSKREEKIMTGEQAASIAIAVLDTPIPSSPAPSQESSRDMKCHGDSKSVSSPNLSSGMSFDKGTGKPCPEMTLTSANTEFEGQNSESAKPFRESAFPGLSQEQSQSHLPIRSPKIRAANHSPDGSSKKSEGKITTSKKTTEGANAVLHESESATAVASQELSRDSVKDHGNHRNLVSMDISSEVTSTNIELEGQISDPSKLGQENASFGMPQEHQLCLPTCSPETGASIHSPVGISKKAEGANAVLDKSESATPEQSQELSRELVGQGVHSNLVSIDISSEMMSSDEVSEVTREPCSEMILTSTNIELEGQKADSSKLFQENASVGMSPEHQLCLPTGLPKIKASIHSLVGILKKAEGNTPTGTKTTEGANTVLDKSGSATPETLQDSTRELTKDLGNHRSVLSLDISSEVTTSVEATRNPCSEIKLASTKSELESQKADSPQLFRESASFGKSPCLPTGLPDIGAEIHSPVGSSKKAEGRSPVGTKTPEGANTALEKSVSATPELLQESTGDLMDHSNQRSLLSLDISSEVMSSVEVTSNRCSEITMTSTNIELEGQKAYSPESFQESGFGLSPEHQPCLPTGLPKTGAASCNTVGSLKKGEFSAGKKATVGAAVLHTPKPSQELLSAKMKGHGDPWKLNTIVASEARSPNMGSGKPWSKIALTSTNIELEGQKSDSPIPSRQSASPGVSLEILSETDRSNCVMAEDVKIGKHQSAEWANVSDEENSENLPFII